MLCRSVSHLRWITPRCTKWPRGGGNRCAQRVQEEVGPNRSLTPTLSSRRPSRRLVPVAMGTIEELLEKKASLLRLTDQPAQM